MLLDHYFKHGIAEGRVPSLLSLKENVAPEITKSGTVLEIGPFTNPKATGANVKYFDVMGKAELVERATMLDRVTDTAVDIDFSDPTGDLSVVDEHFDKVISSHCIEHQPNLVSHLNKVADVLNPNGAYYVICPDKRYCFDHFIPETTIVDVLVAARENRTVHTLHKVVEHKTIVTHNDPKRHWAGDHGTLCYKQHGHIPIARAMKVFDDANGGYIDVHAWQFTPNNFLSITDELFDFGFTRLRVDTLYPTPKNRFEFIAVLKVSDG